MSKRPCLANAINTGLVMCLGDVIAQLVLENRGLLEFEVFRNLRFTSVGFFLAGPGMHHFYSLLDRKIIVGSQAARTLKKLCWDQIFFLPLYLFIYLVVIAILRGDSSETIKQKVVRDMTDGLIVSYKVWPVVQIVNFYLIPSRYRVLLINFVALFWNTYIGWKAETKLSSVQCLQKECL
ncbi:hypothetical protein HELRODRAFT_80158 [Helobdella robusta]|uniref:Mitochondrial inner membrane protein Mpv17 n=1 Tax=Helobdella robusta TaxID=6412 RepID=T1G3Y4_HELRO|nr:hypothetical protein HELRODRAFT_80158 [Helobdella robusta]ESO03756.1 hypothetical protein HELRODRAFT_80158 [Helobdella robusta]